jgi:hypothetical protein
MLQFNHREKRLSSFASPLTGHIMKTLKVALIVITIPALAGIVCWYRYTGTPQHSLMLLANAVKSKDYESG